MIPSSEITGLILAGGQGARMGGLDKGLQTYRGAALALHALRRLAPQVGSVMISANRHLATYAAMGAPVWPDAVHAPGAADAPDAPEAHAGPLAGWLSGLRHAPTRYLASVPCDSPNFPHDLVERLAQALQAQAATLAVAATSERGERRLQPIFALLSTELIEPLAAALQAGMRQVERFARSQACAVVTFDDAAAFANANTLAELAALQHG